MTRRATTITVIGMAIAIVSCSRGGELQTAVAPCPSTAVKVFLASDGTVVLNDKTVSANDLRGALDRMSPRPTEVCYSRENPNGPPPPQTASVLDTIAALKAPISFYTDRTFTKRLVPN
jgi:hypothetical protein